MKKLVIATLTILLLCSFIPFTLAADTPQASVRYINVEKIDYITNYQGEFATPLNVTHFTFTFALWKINTWSDQAYYTAYVERAGKNVIVANWSIGFSTTGGIQGIFIDWNSDLIAVESDSEPYKTETLTNTIDGTQNYWFYRVNFYFNNSLFKNEIVTIASDYMKVPIVAATASITGATVTPLFIGQSVSNTGDQNQYKILDTTNPESYSYVTVPQNINVIPEVPFGSLFAIITMIIGWFIFKMRKPR